MEYFFTSPILAILFLILSVLLVGLAYYRAKPKKKEKSSFPEP